MREIIEGVLQGNERGYAFLIPSDEKIKEDYFIPHSELKGGMHGDRVLCETTDYSGNRTTARVLKILERGIEKLVGTYFSTRTGGFVVPDDKKYFTDIFVPSDKTFRAKSGDKVVVRILSYPKKKSPEGMVIKILGRQFEKNAELKSILYTYNLPEKFPKTVIDYVEDNLSEPTKDDIKGRKDYRNLLTFTIDGEDAKDFDDAVSIEELDNGKFKLFVHIADVSHYVKANTPVDYEAYKRGTSVYFPESVIPMLPEKLSNDLCSLKEGVDRLTMSCVMTIDKAGKVIDSEICPSVIKSAKRLTYTFVQSILDGEEESVNKYPLITEKILLMDRLTDILTNKRKQKGSIDLDVKESAISVGAKGEILVKSAKQIKSQKIIEEFMILANVTVAEFMYYLENPFIYRVHEKPSEEKLSTFFAFLNGIGVKARINREGVHSKDFQKVLSSVENTPYFVMVNRVMLRSMQKAKYSEQNDIHFGLSETHYCHFTSPIRRYPDLVVHRILNDFFLGNVDLNERYSEFVEKASKQSSEKERNAMNAERAVDDYYKILYISGYEGEEFDAIISGVTNFGLFCELDNGIEGLVKIETLKGKRYNFDAKKFTLSDGKKTYKLGEKVKIKVAGVNIIDKRAEFVLVE